MKKYIEVVNGNEEKAKRSLIRKDAIIGVDDMGEKARIVIADQSERKSILYTPTSYDEIKEELSDEEWAKKTASKAVRVLQMIAFDNVTTAEVYEAFERRLTEILKGED